MAQTTRDVFCPSCGRKFTTSQQSGDSLVYFPIGPCWLIPTHISNSTAKNDLEEMYRDGKYKWCEGSGKEIPFS